MTFLSINNEYCKTLAQLKGYFNLTLLPQEKIYLDLLVNGRNHVISQWLRKFGATQSAMQLEKINPNLSDSEFFAKMSSIILACEDIGEFKSIIKFSQCLKLDCVEQDEDAHGKLIRLNLKVLLPIDASYLLKVQTSWGTKASIVNPLVGSEKKVINETFHFRKRRGIGFDILGLFADGEVMTTRTINEKLQGGTSDDNFVDLGLSVSWAKCNLGASIPEEYGNYYAWGETESKDEYSSKNSKILMKNMSCIAGDSKYDAVTAALGQGMRLPTKEEMKELVDKCSSKWSIQNGVRGRLVTGPNGNSIFLPATGLWEETLIRLAGDYGSYWSATPCGDDNDRAYGLFFHYNNFEWGRGIGYDGRTVRPVREIKA